MALLKTRHGLTTTHQSQSAEILAALEAHPAFRAAHIVLLYYSLKDEVDCSTTLSETKWIHIHLSKNGAVKNEYCFRLS